VKSRQAKAREAKGGRAARKSAHCWARHKVSVGLKQLKAKGSPVRGAAQGASHGPPSCLPAACRCFLAFWYRNTAFAHSLFAVSICAQCSPRAPHNSAFCATSGHQTPKENEAGTSTFCLSLFFQPLHAIRTLCSISFAS
jgi:hypothetical protein